MKYLIIMLALISAPSFSCVTTTRLFDSDHLVETLLNRMIPDATILKDHYGSPTVEVLRYYPTFLDRLALSSIGGFSGTSCEITGPNGEKVMMGTPKEVTDFRYTLEKSDGTQCTADLHLIVKTTKAKAKFLSTTCL